MHKELLKSNVVVSIQISQVCEKLISERIYQTKRRNITITKGAFSINQVCVLLFAIFENPSKNPFSVTLLQKQLSVVYLVLLDQFSWLAVDNWSTMDHVMSQ